MLRKIDHRKIVGTENSLGQSHLSDIKIIFMETNL